MLDNVRNHGRIRGLKCGGR